MVYLDYNASTPLDELVRSAMAEVELYAVNPGSIQHRSGAVTSHILEEARDSIATSLGVSDQEIIFTSGSTEGISIAILGVLANLPKARRGIVVAATEHKAVLQAAVQAQNHLGADVYFLGVNETGAIDIDALEKVLETEKFGLVAIMSANNETGVIQDTRRVSEIVRRYGALYLCDLTQSVGKEDIQPRVGHCDIAVLSAHKIYGPKGCGILFARREAQAAIAPLFSGGGQERGLRGGTPNTPGAVGLAQALKLATGEVQNFTKHYEGLASVFRAGLEEIDIGFAEIGQASPRLPNTINVRFIGIDAEILMANMPKVEVSTGSACNSAVVEPSHVLLAHGLSIAEASECIRFSFGKDTTVAEIMFAVDELARAVERIRQIELAG